MIHDFDSIIDRKNTYSTQWDFVIDRFGEADLLPFSISDTDFRAPERLLNKLHQVIDHGIFGYSRWNHADFKQTITHYYQRAHHTKVADEWVVYSPSILYSISVLLRLLTEKDEGVLVFDPMYDAFIKVVNENDRKLLTVPLKREEHYKIDFALLEEKIAKCKVFLLCSPHNPTGKVFTKEELAKIISLCKKYQVYLISDEIHSDIILFDAVHYPILNWYNDYDRLILLNSASKTFNIPGLGGSYGLIPDQELRTEFLVQTRERDFVNSPSIMGMIATMTAYNECQEYVMELVHYIEENMRQLKNYLAEQLPEIQFELPQATYLAWLDVRGLPFSDDELQKALVQVGKVGIMRGDVYGAEGRGFLRMNVGCPQVKMLEGLQRMKQSMDFLEEG